MTTRDRILEIAHAEIGPQSKGSLKVEAYWRAVLPPEWTDAQVHLYAKTKEWCGCFALFCLKQAELAQDVFWHDGLGFLGPAKLHVTKTPSRGDIGYRAQSFQHHFLYAYEDGNGWIHGVGGNTPGVSEQRFRKDQVVFYSIEPLLAQVPDTEPAPPPEEPLPEAGFLRGQKYSVTGIQDEPEKP